MRAGSGRAAGASRPRCTSSVPAGRAAWPAAPATCLHAPRRNGVAVGRHRATDPRGGSLLARSASEGALSLNMSQAVEQLEAPEQRSVRSSWGSLQEADEDLLDDAPPPPSPRAPSQPLKINTDLRLVSRGGVPGACRGLRAPCSGDGGRGRASRRRSAASTAPRSSSRIAAQRPASQPLHSAALAYTAPPRAPPRSTARASHA